MRLSTFVQEANLATRWHAHVSRKVVAWEDDADSCLLTGSEGI